MLGRLLLVHGLWCYDRVGKVSSFMIYKQMLVNATILLYNLYNGLSGTLLYSSVGIAGYAAVSTFFPVVMVGCFDEAVRAPTAYAALRAGDRQAAERAGLLHWRE